MTWLVWSCVVSQVVSVGHESGPTDVTLTLTKQGDKQPLKTTATTAGGAYTFENVLPGEYEVAASHPRWQFQVVSEEEYLDGLAVETVVSPVC